MTLALGRVQLMATWGIISGFFWVLSRVTLGQTAITNLELQTAEDGTSALLRLPVNTTVNL